MTFESIDTYDISITKAIKSHYKDIIHQIGENQNREGLLDTPKRAAKAMLRLVPPRTRIVSTSLAPCSPKTRFLFFVPLPNVMVFNWKNYKAIFIVLVFYL